MQKEDNKTGQKICVLDRTKTELDGVVGVLTFDAGFVLLECPNERISIEGEDLKIENLSKDSGKIIITGRINGLFYSDYKRKRKLFAHNK